MLLAERYNQKQIKEVLKTVGVHIASETSTDFLCLCPFHDNKKTPSFAVSYEKGLYVCYNPSCGAKGKLVDLVKKIGHLNDFQAMRLMSNLKKEQYETFDDDLEALMEDKPEFEEFSQDTLDKLFKDLNSSERAKQYFLSRGINHESINYFRAESKLSTWIYRITVTKAINQVKLINRKKQYAALVSFFADDSVMQKAQASENHNPEFEIERQDKAEILNSALAKLPENQRVAFTLSKVSELSYSEIAEIMNTSVSAIESLIHRAKTRLREKLYQYYTKHLYTHNDVNVEPKYYIGQNQDKDSLLL